MPSGPTARSSLGGSSCRFYAARLQPLDLTLDDTSYIDFERSIHDEAYKTIAHPHIKLDNGEFQWTSINLTLVK